MKTTPSKPNIRYAFFGTSHIAQHVLDALIAAGYAPARVVTAPDRPQGRGLILTPSTIAARAEELGIPTDKPEKLTPEWIAAFAQHHWDVCVVADYGLILPKALLTVPIRGFLNMHPSLLPRLRGPSPIRSAILLDERRTGVTVMQVDAKMDHGPIVAQEVVEVPTWPPRAAELETLLASSGGMLLAQVLPAWVAGDVHSREQDHAHATFTSFFTKSDGLLDLVAGDPYQNLLKIRALETWPGTFTYFERQGVRIRVSIADAHLENGLLVLDRVVPEGKKEMSYADFVRSGAVVLPIPRE
jgi:methionyl-tRNA formyltransferase